MHDEGDAITLTRPVLSRRDVQELLDDPRAVIADLPDNLRDIRRLNRWFGGTPVALHYIRHVLGSYSDALLLDVATGSADIPLAAWKWASRRGIKLTVTASDSSSEVLDEARRVVGAFPVILVQADARELPWPEGSFDLVTCCLAIHHFSPNEAEQVMAEMWRVARGAVVIIDLHRGYFAYAATWLATHLVARNRLTRHDGPLSVLRAYTPSELCEMAGRAGLQNVSLSRHPFFRQALVARKISHAR